MSETNSCPKCGAERDEAADGVEWKCGSWMRRDTFEQGDLCEAWVQVAALSAAKEQAERERDEAKERADKIKAYTHKRMDDGGVPHTVPESPHTAAGCRIGGRFDWLFAQLDEARRDRHEESNRADGFLRELNAVGAEYMDCQEVASIIAAGIESYEGDYLIEEIIGLISPTLGRLTAAEAEVRALRGRWNRLETAAYVALAHITELRDAWMRGVISERDGKGGVRSNTNVAVETELRAALLAPAEKGAWDAS